MYSYSVREAQFPRSESQFPRTETESPISLDMACQRALSAVACTFEFTNVDDGDYYLLKRNTPLEGARSPFLTVTTDDVALEYDGEHVSRNAPPGKDEFVLLRPGDYVTATIQLNDVFALSTDGFYNIEYSEPLQVIRKEMMELESYNEEMVEYEVSQSVSMYLSDAGSLSHPRYFQNVNSQSCTSVYRFVGGSAKARADTTQAHRKLCKKFFTASGQVTSGTLYTTWFGTYSASRANVVRNTLVRTLYKICSTQITYNFNADKDRCKNNELLAYTDYNSKTIYLCDSFANEGNIFCTKNAVKSKEHELARTWTVLAANTKITASGEGPSKDLAKKDPDAATVNSDNYGYFYCRQA